jgi:hypothetical protein
MIHNSQWHCKPLVHATVQASASDEAKAGMATHAGTVGRVVRGGTQTWADRHAALRRQWTGKNYEQSAPCSMLSGIEPNATRHITVACGTVILRSSAPTGSA